MVSPMLLRERMEVVGSDGVHVGFVDHVQGTDEVMLARDDPDAGGQEHSIPLDWIVHAEIKAHLRLCGTEAKARWGTH